MERGILDGSHFFAVSSGLLAVGERLASAAKMFPLAKKLGLGSVVSAVIAGITHELDIERSLVLEDVCIDGVEVLQNGRGNVNIDSTAALSVFAAGVVPRTTQTPGKGEVYEGPWVIVSETEVVERGVTGLTGEADYTFSSNWDYTAHYWEEADGKVEFVLSGLQWRNMTRRYLTIMHSKTKEKRNVTLPPDDKSWKFGIALGSEYESDGEKCREDSDTYLTISVFGKRFTLYANPTSYIR